MQLKNSAERYGLVAQLFHWTIVVLIVVQFVLANLAEDASSQLQKAKLLTTHKSFGMTIFMFAILRLLWRFANRVPEPLPTERHWQRRVATVVHWLLYALILATPLMGWLMSSARNFSVSWFGLFTFPNLVEPNQESFELFRTIHGLLAASIFCIAVLHIAAALKHHFYDHDNVLRRMLPGRFG